MKDSKIKNLEAKLDLIKTNEIDASDEKILKELDEINQKDFLSAEEIKYLNNLDTDLNKIHLDKSKAINKDDDFQLQHKEYNAINSEKFYNKTVDEMPKEIKEQKTIIELLISDDELKAFINIRTNSDQPSLTSTDVKNFLHDQGINYGISESSIEEAVQIFLKDKTIVNHLVAEGKMPNVGKNAKIIFNYTNDQKLVNQHVLEELVNQDKKPCK